MKSTTLALVAALSIASLQAAADDSSENSGADVLSQSPRFLTDERSLTQGSVTIGGQKLEYQAEAGLLVVHLTDPMDEDPTRCSSIIN